MKYSMFMVATTLAATVATFPGSVVAMAADSEGTQAAQTTPINTSQPVGTSQSQSASNANVGAGQVLVIGSSVSAGWRDDASVGGFIQRAFHTVSAMQENDYAIDNQSQPGNGVMHITDQYLTWLHHDHPDVVVLGWGGLDDLHDKTPMEDFRNQIWWQISNALAKHAVVFVITPPISRASYTNYAEQQPMLFRNEKSIAHSFHNPNVYVFDVFNEMKSYLKVHNKTYAPYMADGWHPNAAGHELAGNILAKDILKAFGDRPIKFQPM